MRIGKTFSLSLYFVSLLVILLLHILEEVLKILLADKSIRR